MASRKFERPRSDSALTVSYWHVASDIHCQYQGRAPDALRINMNKLNSILNTIARSPMYYVLPTRRELTGKTDCPARDAVPPTVGPEIYLHEPLYHEATLSNLGKDRQEAITVLEGSAMPSKRTRFLFCCTCNLLSTDTPHLHPIQSPFHNRCV